MSETFAKSPSGFYTLWSKVPKAFPLRKEQDKVLRELFLHFFLGTAESYPLEL